MSCDQQGTVYNSKIKLKTKIFKYEKGTTPFNEAFIVGFAGITNEWMDIVDYLHNVESYKKPPVMNSSTGLVLSESGKIYHFTKPDKWLLIDQPFYAIGSGSQYAIGAMQQKATTREAVKVAMNNDINTGFGIKTLKFK